MLLFVLGLIFHYLITRYTIVLLKGDIKVSPALVEVRNKLDIGKEFDVKSVPRGNLTYNIFINLDVGFEIQNLIYVPVQEILAPILVPDVVPDVSYVGTRAVLDKGKAVVPAALYVKRLLLFNDQPLK